MSITILTQAQNNKQKNILNFSGSIDGHMGVSIQLQQVGTEKDTGTNAGGTRYLYEGYCIYESYSVKSDKFQLKGYSSLGMYHLEEMENGKKTGRSFTIGPSPMGDFGGEWKN